jgi:hypothetical protein
LYVPKPAEGTASFDKQLQKWGRLRSCSACIGPYSRRQCGFGELLNTGIGDGIISATNMAVEIRKVEASPGVPRMVLSLDNKWL